MNANERGFSALELLVIIVIICALVAIGVPTLHARAKASVLEANLQTLGSLVSEQVAAGYSPEYRPSGEGDEAFYLSNHLEESLSAADKGDFQNPFINTEGGRAVVNSRTVPADPEAASPAVLITDYPQYQYLCFGALSEASRRLLAGAMIIAFNSEAGTVDVFYVGAEGQKSSDVVSVPTR
jgi:type II secretory pathway pseudopilin PulG